MHERPHLRCLGQPALFAPTGEPVRIRTKKHLALLIYLAVEGKRTHRRDRLAELLWPDVPLPEARHSLATALSILRPRLGPGAIEATRDQVVLVEGCVSMDLDRLLSGEIMATATQGSLEVAGFLEGFDIPDAAEYGLWKDRQRARLLPAIRAALVQLIDRCRRTADSRQIEHLADTMLALDDLSEEAVRAKMEARAFAGDRLTALRIFEEWKERLAEAVGAQPSEMVEGMAARLRRRGWESANPADSPSVRTEQWRDRSFVGRAREYQRLYEGWERTKRGEATHALILGDSGVGKSTLVDRLTTAAGLEGAITSRAQCYDLEQEIPFAALCNLIRGLLDCPGVSATPPEALAEMALTIKDVRRRFPAIPVVNESRGETARLKLTDAVCQLLETLTEEHPVILVIDDLHLCDDASLSVLHLIAHRSTGLPLMLVLVARPGELVNPSQATHLRTNASSVGIQEIDLPPLSSDESDELLACLLATTGPSLDPSIRRAMIRAAGGYPMILEFLAQDWATNQDQSLALALTAMTVNFTPRTGTSPIYKRVIDRLNLAFEDDTRHVLSVAAVLGHRLNDLSLYSIADLSSGQILNAMTNLVRHRVLRDNGTGLEFVNEFVRAATYLEIPSPVRRSLHASIAERLIAEDHRGVRFLGLEIAWHATRAGEVAKLPAYLFKGAQEAIAHGALDSAVRALETAMAQLAPQDERMARLLLAEALQEQGRWKESARVLANNGLTRTGALGAVYAILAEHRVTTPDAATSHRNIETLLKVVQAEPLQKERLKAANAAAQMMSDIRSHTHSEALVNAIQQIPRDGLTEDELDQLDLSHAQLLYYAGRHHAVMAKLSTLVASLDRRRVANSTLARAYVGLGVAECREGNYEGGKTNYLTAYAIAGRLGNEGQQIYIAANLAMCCHRLGKFDELLAWAEKASIGEYSRYQSLQVTYCKASALALMGELSEALKSFTTMDSKIPHDSPAWLVQAWGLYRADVLFLCGHANAALDQAREALGGTRPALQTLAFAGVFARWLAVVSRRDDTMSSARSILGELGKRIDELDAVDRAELTCAQLLLEGTSSRLTALSELLAEHLAKLPPTIEGQLKRLGVLQTTATRL